MKKALPKLENKSKIHMSNSIVFKLKDDKKEQQAKINLKEDNWKANEQAKEAYFNYYIVRLNNLFKQFYISIE